jgi:carbon starvation protein
MFEALFILTTIDAGTRVSRFLLQEFLGRVHRPFERTNWLPGTLLTSLLIVAGWTYFILTGSIRTIWPMFGIANQLLAAVALTVGTTVLINTGRARYAWVTAVPLAGVTVITQTAGFLSIRDNYLPMLASREPGAAFQGGLNAALTGIMMACMGLVLVEASVRWMRVLRGQVPVRPDGLPGRGGAPVAVEGGSGDGAGGGPAGGGADGGTAACC